MPPSQTPRQVSSSLLGLLALLALPILVALYAAVLFGTIALALHALRWLMA